ncbi:MAG: proline racemase family protein [Propionibacteriaceae bacterium]|jgi:proline racemase|nr:proline racemase family protein [Propionibacteriaceae bacterium]
MGIPINTVEYHTGGEPFRIIANPPHRIAGATVGERRVFAISDPKVDGLRRLLCHEPRGHADMYGGFIVEPDDSDAHFGVLFWHKDGFSTACGHGTIALGAWAVRSGIVSAEPTGVTPVRIDVPSGRVTANVHTINGRVTAVDFINVPSYLIAKDLVISTSQGPATVDVGYGGAIYAHVPAAQFGLAVTPGHYADLIAVGREIKWLLNKHDVAKHPSDPRLDGIYGTILYDDFGADAEGQLFQRNVTVFADGEVDRSPCGSGTASRLAVLAAKGELAEGQVLVHDSIIGSRFIGRIGESLVAEGRDAVIPVVTGNAFEVGTASFTVDEDDELVPGFVLR